MIIYVFKAHEILTLTVVFLSFRIWWNFTLGFSILRSIFSGEYIKKVTLLNKFKDHWSR